MGQSDDGLLRVPEHGLRGDVPQQSREMCSGNFAFSTHAQPEMSWGRTILRGPSGVHSVLLFASGAS
eukprot:3508634-Lingulodinium_polyedra.AAC.1